MTLIPSSYAVQASADFERIRDLPRRKDPCVDLTPYLKTHDGGQRLRPEQNQALHDLGTVGGLLAPISVGKGKTLISLLAPVVTEARAPLLLLPAALISKTEKERPRYAKDWQVSRALRLLSYEALGRVSGSQFLDLYKPDLIICDESHRLKNRKAAVTRRVARYLKEHPDCKFVAMSGTLIKHSVRDFGHLAAWSLKQGSPLPLEQDVLEEWANAIDNQKDFTRQTAPGVLGATQELARKWFQSRLSETPGVVCSLGEGVSCSLRIEGKTYQVSDKTEENFRTLRTLWETPSGWALSTAVDIWRHARELSLGLHYEWQPPPPQEWLLARRAWAKFVRDTLSRSRHLDSELQVAQAVDDGLADRWVLEAWRAVRPTFEINSVPVWHDDHALVWAEEWAAKAPGIVWTNHSFFARELSRRTGLPYYGRQGLDSHGRFIEDEKGDRSIIASVKANCTGRNLQGAFCRNLFTSPDAGADSWEQTIGRTHREGQESDEVAVDVMVGCLEDYESLDRALEDARMQSETIGSPQKLLVADVVWPDVCKAGHRWKK